MIFIKKKKQERLYGQLPTFENDRKYSRYKTNFTGLYETGAINSGAICDCYNISFDDYPYATVRKAYTVHNIHDSDEQNLVFRYNAYAPGSTWFYLLPYSSNGGTVSDNKMFSSDWAYAGACDDYVVFLNAIPNSDGDYSKFVTEYEKSIETVTDEETVKPYTIPVSDNYGCVIHKIKIDEKSVGFIETEVHSFNSESTGVVFPKISEYGISKKTYEKVEKYNSSFAFNITSEMPKLDCPTISSKNNLYFTLVPWKTQADTDDTENYWGINIDTEINFKFDDSNYEVSALVPRSWSNSDGTSQGSFKNLKCVAINNGRFYFANMSFYKISDIEDGDYPSYVYVSPKLKNLDTPISIGNFSTDSTDSWASASDDEGEFLGLWAYNETVIGFKRKSIYVISRLKNPFLITRIQKKGCVSFGSVCEIGEYLYFLSDDGVNVFNGSTCKVISDAINFPSFSPDACRITAGTDGRHYFLFVRFLNNDEKFYIYDTKYGTWTKWGYEMKTYRYFLSSETTFISTITNPIRKFFHLHDRTFFAQEYLMSLAEIKTKETGDFNYEDYSEVKWDITLDIMTLNSQAGTVDIKHIKQFKLFADVVPETTLTFEYILDNKEAIKLKEFTVPGEDKNKIIHKSFIVNPLKSAHTSYKLKISGTGYCKLYELETVYENGGTLYD